MDTRTVLNFLKVAEKLKCNTRHSYTSSGRAESVAEHTFRLCVFAWLVKDEFPGVDINRVTQMCLFHDFGEAVTGDIPVFEKNSMDEVTEAQAVEQLLTLLPGRDAGELRELFAEMDARNTPEAKLFHALDKMEAVIQHNEADISTWIPLEYDLQLTHGRKEAEAFPYMKELRELVAEDSLKKIEEEKAHQ